MRNRSPDQTMPSPALREARLGLVATTRNLAEPALHRELCKALGPLWSIVTFQSYAALSDALGRGEVDLAWLSPLAYARAGRLGTADLVLTLERANSPSYASALVVRRDAEIYNIQQLARTRAAWVDPLSAAGYLMPRRIVRSASLDPSHLFLTQKFFGSHDAAIDAVVRGRADVCGTFCSVEPDGSLIRTAWRPDQPVRPLAVSEAIPGDTICASPRLGVRDGRALAARLISLAVTGENRALLLRVFGADRFVPGNPQRYEVLADALDEDTHATEP